MHFKKTPSEKTELEKAIEKVLFEMDEYTSDMDEYARMVDQLEKLYKLKDIDKPTRVSADTVAMITANLVGIAMIIGYERANILTSKALSVLFKLR